MEGLAGLFANLGGGAPPPMPSGMAGAGGPGGPDLNDFMKSMGGGEEMKGHAERLWAHMDELAASDPDGYRKFLADQMKGAGMDAKQAPGQGKGPSGVFVIETQQKGASGSAPAAVEIFRAEGGLPAPVLPSGTSLSKAKLAKLEPAKLGKVAFAFSPRTGRAEAVEERPGRRGPEQVYRLETHRVAIDAALVAEPVLQALVERTLQQLETQHRVAFDRTQNRVLTSKAEMPEESVKAAERRQMEVAAERAAEALGPEAAALPKSILTDLASMAVGGNKAQGPVQGPAKPPGPPVQGPAKPLIMMMDDETPSPAPTVEYTVTEEKGDEGQPTGVVLVFELPGLSRAADADLAVEGGEVSLVATVGAGEEERVSVPLPFPVDEDRAKAKFDKVNKRLTVRLPAIEA